MSESAAEIDAIDLDELLGRARDLASAGERRVLAIVGAPGSGKTTLAATIGQRLGADAVVVPMDGYHLSDKELKRLGRIERKGAPDTFDASGFVSLLARLARNDEPVVYAPEFDRTLEDPVAGSIPVPEEVPLVIIEGNYLLLDEEPWSSARGLLDESWFVMTDEPVRLERLVARHVEFGRSPESAAEHAQGSDQRNAELVANTAPRADLVIDITRWPLVIDSE